MNVRQWIKKIGIQLIQKIPLREDIILESHPDFSDNALAFYEYLLQKKVNTRHKIYWAVYNHTLSIPPLPEQVDYFYLDARGLKQMIKRFLALYRCKYIFDSNAYIKKRRSDQVRIHLGHGMLIKITKDYHNMQKIGELDGYLTTSLYWEGVFTDRIGIPKECLLPLGYPRTDELYRYKEEQNYVIWLPTYRQHRLHKGQGLSVMSPYGMPGIMTQDELQELDETLKKQGLTMYFRPHPVQDLSLLHTMTLDAVTIADDDFLKKHKMTLYQLLAGAKALLTDYSSVYYDFLLTERPIGLTIMDSEQYFSMYDCAFPHYEDGIKGSYLYTAQDIREFIEHLPEERQQHQAELRELKTRYVECSDGRACEKLYHYMKDHYGFDR